MIVGLVLLQLPWRQAQEPVELDVDAVDYVPVRRLRRHCSKHVLWSRHRRLDRRHSQFAIINNMRSLRPDSLVIAMCKRSV